MPKLARIALGWALLSAAVAVIGSLTVAISALPLALPPLFAGIGIWRRRAWSAYGYALVLGAHALLVPFVLLRPGNGTGQLQLIVTWASSAGFAILFFFAGKSLESTRSAKGAAWPWIAVAAVTSVPLLFVQPFIQPTPSMEDTVLSGDRFLVQRFPKPHPERGNLIVFVYPVASRQTFLKRVIGVAGDRIHITDKMVFRNGIELAEPYAVHKTGYEDSYRDNFPSKPTIPLEASGIDMLAHHVVDEEVVVPEGKYFVLGDNRDNSLDSRYWGFVSAGDLLGKPLLIYDSRAQDANGLPRFNRFFTLLK